MYTVRVAEPNPQLASLILEQFGGPQGELAAAMRYFTQAITDDDPMRKDLLYDIATEEMSHLEVIGSILVMLNKGVRGKITEGMEEGMLLKEVCAGGESHVTSLLYGGGAALINSGGVPWTAAYVDSIGDPAADLRSNIAAESRAKIVYERLINVTDDKGIKDALGFLMTREVAHQKAFEKALYAIQDNFPPGKIPGVKKYVDKYYDTSVGEKNARGPWNEGDEWEYVENMQEFAPVDGGPGDAQVSGLSSVEKKSIEKASQRLATRNSGYNPTTGADLGAKADGSAGTTKSVDADAEDDVSVKASKKSPAKNGKSVVNKKSR